MTVNLSASLVGLSMLSGQNAFSLTAPVAFESKAVRTAKAQFTLAPTTPPWKDPKVKPASASQISSILAARTLLEKSNVDGTGKLLPDDVQTSFTTYKALDKLRVLAEAAAAKTTSDAQRASYQKAFSNGLAEIQGFLATAPSDKVNLAFGRPTSTVASSQLASSNIYEVSGKSLVSKRSDPLPGLKGDEQFEITLNRPGLTQKFTIDLAQGPQPPTMDSVVDALNAQISSVLVYQADGTPQLDSKGNPVSRWLARFEPEFKDNKWGLRLSVPDGLEQVSLDQVNSKDSLVVATGQTALDAPTATQVFRLNDPAGTPTNVAMGTIQALDRTLTKQNELAGKTTNVTTTTVDLDGKVQKKTEKTSNAYASTDAAAVVSDGQGYTYVVGTTKGDLGANLSDGDNNLFLTKMDGAGNVVWQRSLGATGTATGASVSLGADGSIVVAGTVTGNFNGVTADGDMVVAKYAANGDEKFSTVVRSTGIDSAKAVTVGTDGSVYVAGRISGEGGDAMIARIDSTGKLAERRTIGTTGSDSINALAIGADGNVLALVSQDGNAKVLKMDAAALSTDLGSIDLGKADARAIAVAADGSIAIGGATNSAISGNQINSISGERDGFVTRIDAGLTSASTTYIGTGADEQVDSIAFLGNDLYAGGRTTGDLAQTRRGPVDGFVTRIDTATGQIASTQQFGQALLRTEPVRITADKGGDNALAALGFGRGTLNPVVSDKVTTQTTLRPGDSFSIRVNDGAIRKITIEANDTLKTIADRMQGMIGASRATVTATSVDGVQSLRISMKAGHELDLIAGPGETDALAKLGLEPQSIVNQGSVSASAPKVRPGGSYGLDLSEALSLSNLDNAKVALAKITDAISVSQSAYRSLYWDDAKATLAEGTVKNTKTGKGSTAIQKSQLANYQAALSRLSQNNSTSIFFGL